VAPLLTDDRVHDPLLALRDDRPSIRTANWMMSLAENTAVM
jgi:hypothetical protein